MKRSLLIRFRRKLKFFKDKSWGNLRLFFNPYCNKTFSQCGEDIIVKHIFDALGIIYPTYIDIGAHHPFKHSNTALFYLLGSHGLNLEPDPELFATIKQQRPRDINLNMGISEKIESLDFYVMQNRTLNTFSHKKAIEYQNEQNVFIEKKKKIHVSTLKKVFEQYGSENFWDFMNLDVEGLELPILSSHDWSGPSPKVICCETISFSNSGKGIKDNKIINFLQQQGYLLYADTHVNSIFVKKELWQKN